MNNNNIQINQDKKARENTLNFFNFESNIKSNEQERLIKRMYGIE